MPVRGLNGRGVFGVSENTDTTADAGEQTEQANGGGDAFRAPASQAELDRIVQTRLDRERSRFSDYDDLKARAAKASEFEAANAELLGKVQGFEAAAARTALVSKVAKDTGVDADILADLRADSEDELTAIASRLRDRFKPTAPLIPGQDKRPENAPIDERKALANQLFNRS